MAYVTNREHFIFFTATTGLQAGNFTTVILIDAASATVSLTFTEVQTGLYCCSYTPTIPGFYYVSISHNGSVVATDTVEIDVATTSNTVGLTQDYGYVGRFKIPTSNPTNTKIVIFNSTDWLVGNISSAYLVGATSVDSSGNWLTTPIYVPHGTYHVVQTIANTTTKVLAAFMVV
jgi:hypothetical protein